MKWPFVLTLTWFQLYSLWYSYQPPESVGGFFTWLFLTLYIIVLNLKSQHAILKSNLLVAPFLTFLCVYTGVWTYSPSIKIEILNSQKFKDMNSLVWETCRKKNTFCGRIQGALDLMMVWLSCTNAI